MQSLLVYTTPVAQPSISGEIFLGPLEVPTDPAVPMKINLQQHVGGVPIPGMVRQVSIPLTAGDIQSILNIIVPRGVITGAFTVAGSTTVV